MLFLCQTVVELLTTLSSITKPVSEFVFAGRNDKKKPICENAVLLVIKQIGYEGLESGHGFRHEFSTIMNEHEWPADAVKCNLHMPTADLCAEFTTMLSISINAEK